MNKPKQFWPFFAQYAIIIILNQEPLSSFVPFLISYIGDLYQRNNGLLEKVSICFKTNETYKLSLLVVNNYWTFFNWTFILCTVFSIFLFHFVGRRMIKYYPCITSLGLKGEREGRGTSPSFLLFVSLSLAHWNCQL